MARKLTLIKSVANKTFGAAIKDNIFSSVFVSEVFNSSMSDGESEKKADSAAETKAIKINNINITKIANKILVDMDFKIKINGSHKIQKSIQLEVSNIISFYSIIFKKKMLSRFYYKKMCCKCNNLEYILKAIKLFYQHFNL